MDERVSYVVVVLSFLFFSSNAFAESNESLLNSFTPIKIATNTFVYNPKTLTWKAINHSGKVVRTGKGSAGKGYCKDTGRRCYTPTGSFRVISKGGPGCRSSRYPVGKGGAPMPYCMFFSKYYAIHGSPDVPNYNASHGCVRVHPGDAQWLNHNFLDVGSRVVIKSY